MANGGLAILAALLVAASATRLLLRAQGWLRIDDVPNSRSLHTRPVPRTGGLALVAAIASGILLIGLAHSWSPPALWTACGALLVAAVSFMDDRAGVGVATRLACHLLAALCLLGAGLLPLSVDSVSVGSNVSTLISVAVALVGVVWMINLYNFMDGMDGFAGGMTVIGFGTYAVLGLLGGHTVFASASAVVAAAALGFLWFNFPPARIFMGDTGASTIGFLVAAFALWAARAGIFEPWIAALIFSPFIVDATLTLLRRAWRGERVWRAHKSHYYQRLVQLGWGHRRTVFAEYGLMGTCAGLALLAQAAGGRVTLGVYIVAGVFYLMLIRWVGRLEQARSAGP